MTNATDILVVGGPAHGNMWCLNRETNAQHKPIEMLLDPSMSVVYQPIEWWHPINERWYWIAVRDEDDTTDIDIAAEIAASGFQPAWDLRGKPAPEPEQSA